MNYIPAIPDILPEHPEHLAAFRAWRDRYLWQLTERDDLVVGPGKPFGYRGMPAEAAIERQRQLDGQDGIVTFFHKDQWSDPGIWWLAAYHHPTLQALLESRRNVLITAGWEVDAHKFTCRVLRESAPFGPNALRDLIADAFDDRTHIERSDVLSQPWWKVARTFMDAYDDIRTVEET